MRVENYSAAEMYDDETHENLLNLNPLSDVSTSLTGDIANGSIDPECNKDTQHQADPTFSLAPSHGVDDIQIAGNDYYDDLLDVILNDTYPESWRRVEEPEAEAQGASNNWISDGPIKSRLRRPAESPLDKDIERSQGNIQEGHEGDNWFF